MALSQISNSDSGSSVRTTLNALIALVGTNTFVNNGVARVDGSGNLAADGTFTYGAAIPGSYSGTQPYLALTPALAPNASFALVPGPNGGNVLPVPTFYPLVANKLMAVDICPNGTPSDAGYGLAWNDICNQDQITGGGSVAYQSLHLSAGGSSIDVASGRGNSASALPLKFGLINLDNASKTASFQINTDATVTFNTNVTFQPIASTTPASNGDLQIQATSNTSLTFKFKGSDGTVRSGSITLA